LLHRAGYDLWTYQNQAMKRAGDFLQRTNGWNHGSISYGNAWLANYRLGTAYPEKPPSNGRMLIGYDWLWGGAPAAGDTTPPTVTITSPAAGATFTTAQTVTVSASASDNVGVSKVSFFDGATLLGTDTSSPFSVAWPISAAKNGSHSLLATAFDAAGNTKQSAPVGVTVDIPASAADTTVVLAPAADGYVNEALPSSSFGTKTVLLTDQGPTQQAYLRFDVSVITGTVKSAKLRIYATNGSTNGPALYTTSPQWTESGLTWNTRPANQTLLGDKGSVSSSTWLEYDVAAAVKANGSYGFAVMPTSSDGFDFQSRENTNKPQLVIVFGS
jgi:hypothetical protein